MSQDKSTRSVNATLELTEAVAEAAWRAKISRAELVRAAIDAYLADPSQIAGWGEDPGNGNKRLTFIVDDARWSNLNSTAWRNRLTLASALRIAVNHYASSILADG